MLTLKGITVEIDGNVTGLTKALSSLNGDIKNTTAQLKDVERLLKLDPGNTELLAQKQKLLGQAVEETKKKLDALKQASNEAAKTAGNYDAWKAKYDPLKKEIDETQTKLKTLKEKAADADKQLSEGKISQKKYDDLQAEIKETEEKLKTLKTQAKEVDEEFGHPISHEQYDALQREIIATENSLKSLEKQSKEAGSKLQDLAHLPVKSSFPSRLLLLPLGLRWSKRLPNSTPRCQGSRPFQVRRKSSLIPYVIKPARWAQRLSTLLKKPVKLWSTWRWQAGTVNRCWPVLRAS